MKKIATHIESVTICLNFIIAMQVTTKGAGLNPNAKVWQEIPAQQNDNPEWTDDSPWLLTYPPSPVMTDGKI